MDLMNYRQKIAMVYSSVTGNTEALVQVIAKQFMSYGLKLDIYRVETFDLEKIADYNAMVIGTYTWGNGEIPKEMMPLYQAFERAGREQLVTGVVGTGDRFYPHFCGAVDEFRDMLFVYTTLAVTLKVELTPESKDIAKCEKFAEIILDRMHGKRTA